MRSEQTESFGVLLLGGELRLELLVLRIPVTICKPSYSPEFKTLLHIDVGEMPEASHPFTGTSDIAFGSNGDL